MILPPSFSSTLDFSFATTVATSLLNNTFTGTTTVSQSLQTIVALSGFLDTVSAGNDSSSATANASAASVRTIMFTAISQVATLVPPSPATDAQLVAAVSAWGSSPYQLTSEVRLAALSLATERTQIYASLLLQVEKSSASGTVPTTVSTTFNNTAVSLSVTEIVAQATVPCLFWER